MSIEILLMVNGQESVFCNIFVVTIIIESVWNGKSFGRKVDVRKVGMEFSNRME